MIISVQFIRFLAVGLTNTVLGLFVIFAAMFLGNLDPVLSNFIGYGVGIILSYSLNSKWTFEGRDAIKFSFIAYVILSLFSYFLNVIVLLYSIKSLGFNPYFAQLMGIPCYTIINYLISKKFIFYVRE